MSLPAKQSDLAKALQKQQEQSADMGDVQYLKMEKAGSWVYGADDDEVSEKSTFIFDPSNSFIGYICWEEDGNEPLDEVMAGVGEAPIIRADLKDYPDGRWSEQRAIGLLGVSGPEAGTKMLFKTSSKGGQAAIKDLIDKVLARINEGEEVICPVIELDSDWYKHKKYGKIFKPVLEVVDWGEADDFKEEAPEALPEPEEDDEPAPERKVRSRKRSL